MNRAPRFATILCKPEFPGYTFEHGKSIYRGEEVGEGGYVYAEPGIYGNVALLDIASMHPSSIVAENLFGDVYTQRFKEILDARIAILWYRLIPGQSQFLMVNAQLNLEFL